MIFSSSGEVLKHTTYPGDSKAKRKSNDSKNKAIQAKKGMSSKEALGYSPVKRDKAAMKRRGY